MSNRTTTNRELYYIFITHFRTQRECDAAIVDVCNLLGVERISLGLSASPKGWFCGNIRIVRQDSNSKQTNVNTSTDGTSLSSIQGLPITREWIHRAAHIIHHSQKDKTRTGIGDDSSSTSSSTSTNSSQESGCGMDNESSNEFKLHHEANFAIQSDAQCIIVAEKEGVYTRLSEDRFFDRVPCILVTGKGFPDIATRALVFVLHNTLDIPVYGLADCNPYGLAVLQTYFRGGMKNEMDGGDRYHVPIQWIGLRPSQLNSENENVDPSFRQMPREVYQKLTELDLKKINSLNNETNQFMNVNEVRTMEMELMKKNGWKVELESLHWLGIDFMSNWLENTLLRNTEIRARSYGDDGGSISDDGSVEFDPRIAI